MSKVFGYTNRGGKDWFKSDGYSDNEIEAIKDPEGGNEISLPTAIPSPFARIDLVKNAFKNVAKSPKLKFHEINGSVITSKEDEKLVSDSLDLAEILFNYDTLRENIKIIVWDKEVEIEKLQNGSRKHQMYADTLMLYLNQDKNTYNFDLVKRIYLFQSNHKIIGATSPSTLFFATANDLSHAQIRITNNDILFDNKYAPLYERDPEFQKYFYSLFKANNLLREKMKGFWDYLQKNLKLLNETNPNLYNEINSIDSNDYFKNYSELNTGTHNDEIEVLGIGLRKRKSEDILEFISNNSDFRINSTKFIGKNKPLVLQNGFNKDWLYVKDKWHKFKVPYFDVNSLDRRKLPEINVQYPYLTVNDFLEPNLIRLVYPFNNEKYFNGNLEIESGDDRKSYLLPIKPLFFEFFNASDLSSGGPGKPSIKMVQSVSNSVKVTLLIPVLGNNGYIAFEKIYFQNNENLNSISDDDDEGRKGIIVEQQIGLTIYPFVRTNLKDISPDYRIQLIDSDVYGQMRFSEYELKYFNDSSTEPIPVRAQKYRSRKIVEEAGTASTQYSVVEKNFDVIQITNKMLGGASGVIIPLWPQFQQGNDIFSFAVDFGTTNTHIEYKIGDGSPKPFDINIEDIQIASLFHPTKTAGGFVIASAESIRVLIEVELMPSLIGNSNENRFPQRTVIGQSEQLEINSETFSMVDFNIPFWYEKVWRKGVKVESNLKWAKKEVGNEKRVRAFFEKVIMLLRNKVLLNKGNLTETKMVWFYPSSMKPARKSSLENTWKELFQAYFHPNNPPIGIAESLAPFFYYKGTGKLQGGSYRPVVSIDIGGGTSDVVIFQANKPLLLTSFKFAANSIFGDGYSEYGSAKTNGIVQKYIPLYDELLQLNGKDNLKLLLDKLLERNKSEDINAFFFSLENNTEIIDKSHFSFNRRLASDEDFVIIFVYFYSAIIYHIAELMKYNGIALPKDVIFSGTGSKMLNVITTNDKILTNLTKVIFENIYGEKFDSETLTIRTDKHIPKEVTCKGGLMLNTEDMDIDLNQIKKTLTYLESKGMEKLTYNLLNEANKSTILVAVKRFNDFFIGLSSQLKFTDNFSISNKSLDLFKLEINKHLQGYLDEGIEFNKKMDDSVDDDKELEESLFFYPIIGAINNLTNLLSDISPIKK